MTGSHRRKHSALIEALGGCDPETRCKVPLRYQELFGKKPWEVVTKECGKRDFGTALQFLAVDPVTAECNMIEKACGGLGTNEVLLYSIIVGRSNKDLDLLKKRYFDMHTKDLGRLLDSELGGDFEKLIFTVFQASEEDYDEGFHTDDKVQEDIKALYDMGQGRMGTHEEGLFKILCKSPPEYLKKLNLAYAEKYGYSLTKMIEKEFKRKTEDATLFMIGMKLKPAETVAKLIDKACKGIGTNELLLTCTLIRYQPIMKDVKLAFTELYGKTLEEKIQKETRRDFEKILLQIVATGSN